MQFEFQQGRRRTRSEIWINHPAAANPGAQGVELTGGVFESRRVLEGMGQ
jgi:hypothetical protein